MFLTPDELVEMTGRKQMRAQAVALTHLGVIHKIRADGKPLVLRAHVEQLLGAGIAPRAKAAPHFEPNWAAANERHPPLVARKEKK
ncbi:DUF4224 domain-containing protein [Massilia sp. DWR3-1-1]|uniref:DUF4224 domain-containing protein n=1 Tax=Massilia sp. DWR3-1-1 TaxID=2804559 RepID=UPI003CFB9675